MINCGAGLRDFLFLHIIASVASVPSCRFVIYYCPSIFLIL